MTEQPPNPPEGEPSAGYTTQELIDAFKDYLDQEDDLPFMEDMLPDEALEYVLQALSSYGVEDPEGMLVEKGFTLEIKENTPEIRQIQNRQSMGGEPFTTGEVDAMLQDKKLD